MVFLKVNVICRIRPDQIWSTLILDGDGILDSCVTLQRIQVHACIIC
jgi:hypothetical protein